MKWYERKNLRCHPQKRHKVYDSVAEAVADGVDEQRFKRYDDLKPQNIQEGDWYVYPDGMVAEIIHVRKIARTGKYPVKSTAYKTILNVFTSYTKVPPSSKWMKSYSNLYDAVNYDPNSVTPMRIKMVEEWLIGGVDLHVAAVKYLRKEWYFFTNQRGLHSHQAGSFTRKAFGYFVVSSPWFDTLLAENRIFKDRYNSLIGAMKSAGIDDTYVAAKLKQYIDQGGKEGMAALKSVILLLDRERDKTPALPASYSIEDEKRMIEDRSQKADVIPIPEGEAYVPAGASTTEQSEVANEATFVEGDKAEGEDRALLVNADQPGGEESRIVN